MSLLRHNKLLGMAIGDMSIMKNGFPLSSPSLQKIGLAFCANKGAHWGGNINAREKSSSFAMEFMKKHLMN